MRISLAQTNPTIGDLRTNTDHIIDAIRAASDAGAALVVFPELAIPGYPPKDLLLREGFVEACERMTAQVAEHARGIVVVVGTPRRASDSEGVGQAGPQVFNSLAWCEDGRVAGWYDKQLLPTYDVFDEDRYFRPGSPEPAVRELDGLRIGMTICEDLWRAEDVAIRHGYDRDPVAALAALRCDLIINPSASPFFLGKPARQRAILAEAARRVDAPVAYVNQVGGNDELVFSGLSCAFDVQGHPIASARGFEADLITFDLADPVCRANIRDDEAQVFDALVLGVRDYCRKCGFESAVLGLSGGIDSALVAVIGAIALGPDRVRGFGLPSRYSSDGSKSDAAELAERLGIGFDLVAIESMHTVVESALAPHFAGREPDETEENIQSRLRGLTLMAFSNKFGSLLLTTGNKTEMAVGYCTLYGDMAGGLAVISDVPKLWVYRLSRWINEHHAAYGLPTPPIPESTLTKPPSAELRPDQRDTDSLPPYEILDEIVARHVEAEQSADRIIAETGFDAGVVNRFVQLIDRNEHKRKQAPIGLKVMSRSFGFGRRFPIAMRYCTD
jgi:NAD+ synthase (glutamine-hydrolysing)